MCNAGIAPATVAFVEDIGKTIAHSNPKISAEALVWTLKATHGAYLGERSAGRLKECSVRSQQGSKCRRVHCFGVRSGAASDRK